MKAFCRFFAASVCCCHTRAFSPTPNWMYGILIVMASDSFHNVTLASNKPQTLRLFEQQHHQQQQHARVLYKRKLFVLFAASLFRPPTCSSNKIFHLLFRFEPRAFLIVRRTHWPYFHSLPHHCLNMAKTKQPVVRLCAPLLVCKTRLLPRPLPLRLRSLLVACTMPLIWMNIYTIVALCWSERTRRKKCACYSANLGFFFACSFAFPFCCVAHHFRSDNVHKRKRLTWYTDSVKFFKSLLQDVSGGRQRRTGTDGGKKLKNGIDNWQYFTSIMDDNWMPSASVPTFAQRCA